MLNKRIILLFGIALAGIALRIKFFTGFVGSDDISYVQTGLLMQFLSDKVAGIQNIIASLRIGMVLPLAVIFRLVGYGPVTAILYPFVCSIATIFVVYLLASYVFEDSKMGLCAAYLWGLMPLDVYLSTIPFPDTALILFLTSSIYFLLKGIRNDNVAFIIVCGLLLGFGQTIKETSFAFLFLAIIYIFFNAPERRKTYILGISLGFLCVIILELAFWIIVTRDPFFRIKHVVANTILWTKEMNYNYGYKTLEDNIQKSLHWLKSLFAIHSPLGSGFFAAPLAIFFTKRLKKNHYGSFLLLWIFVVVLYLLFMIWRYPSFQPRYFLLLAVPATLISAFFFVSFLRKFRLFGYCALVLAGVFSIYQMFAHSFHYSGRNIKDISILSKEFRNSEFPFFMDAHSARVWQLCNGFRTADHIFFFPKGDLYNPGVIYSVSSLSGLPLNSHIFLKWKYIAWLAKFSEIPHEIYNPPLTWYPRRFMRSSADRWMSVLLENNQQEVVLLPFYSYVASVVGSSDVRDGHDTRKLRTSPFFFNIEKPMAKGVYRLVVSMKTDKPVIIVLYRTVKGNRVYENKVGFYPSYLRGGSYWIQIAVPGEYGLRFESTSSSMQCLLEKVSVDKFSF